jgi:hypothetical protein
LCTRFICIIFPSARVRWLKKKKNRDLSSTSVICLPRHLFLNPQLTNGCMPTVDCQLSRRAPQRPKCSLKQSFFAATFSSKR